MKKGMNPLLLLCLLSFCVALGFFVGRTTSSDVVMLQQNEYTEPSAAPENTKDSSVDYRLDINTATKYQLMELPGIGEVLAQRILQYREENGAFPSIDHIMDVEGIGEVKFDGIRDLIKIGG